MSLFVLLLILLFSTVFSPSYGADVISDDGTGDGMFENFVEGYVKDFFNKELDTTRQQNLTDCMTRLLCENICQRTVKGEIKIGEPMINSVEMLGTTEKDPMGYFFSGGDRGYEFGRHNQCHQCAIRYSNCPANQYDQTRTMSDKYEKDMIKVAESSIMDFDKNDPLSIDL
ncbi:hypothetical protein DERF_007809 [Dermatophagoides farinae]|uniref:Uncharacterized protein n=1 Tax=Dermatophagoides farinae TaxID=6954 RepID=A0A922I1V7_DERFA|nr:hypothetical protein HUG17_2129 [Dermatophagoides farinae]KAH9517112.1 hypothetical protein DERF_007809 [Dermatophagoides farinae]